MTILGIETSCDETGAALLSWEKNSPHPTLLSNELATSLLMHAKTGGIIPENAAREQIKFIIPVIQKALTPLKNPERELDAIAVTYGPGLIGSLLVGVETAKTLSYLWGKPLIPVNHLYGHIYANWLSSSVISNEVRNLHGISRRFAPRNDKEIKFPALALVVSGGHTDLVLMKDHNNLTVIGATRDDAAGEAFDKIGRLLGFAYPAGAEIAKRAVGGDPKSFKLPRPMIGSHDFDFSFSGLKTAAISFTKNNTQLSAVISRRSREISMGSLADARDDKLIADFCVSVQSAIVDVLVKKTIKAAKQHEVKSILLGGGVAANQKLREHLKCEIENLKLKISLFFPPPNLCTDNGAMIAAAGFFAKPVPWQAITADPELYY